MKRLFYVCLFAVACGSSAIGQSRDQVDTSPYQVMLSLGVSGYIFDADPQLKGKPRNSLEVRKERFVIEPAKAVIAFPKSTVTVGGVKHTAVLTEDGLWGMVPLRSGTGFSYFLDEVTIQQVYEAYKESGDVSWTVVTANFAGSDARISFTRGEIFQLDTISEGEATAVIDPSLSFMRTKASQIQSLSPPSDQVQVRDGKLFVKLGGAQVGQVEYVGGQIIDVMSAKEDATDFWSDRVVLEWPKTISLGTAVRISCDMQEEIKKSVAQDASASVKASFSSGGVLPALQALGLSIDAELALKASQSFTTTIEQVIKDKLFEVTDFVVSTRSGPKLVSFGLGGDCPTEDAASDDEVLYPYAIVQGIPGTAVDRDVIEELETHTGGKVVWGKKNGYLSSPCVQDGFAQVVSFLSEERGIDDRIARFMAARWMRTAQSPANDCPSS